MLTATFTGEVIEGGDVPACGANEQQKPITVFLVDDHEVVRRGVRWLLEASTGIEVVGEAGTMDEALRRIPSLGPQVAILDIGLPDGSGIEVCRSIRVHQPATACLMLTAHNDDEALFDAIMAGAAGYLLKHVHGYDLVAAVRQVARGESLLDPASTGRVLARMRNPPQEDARLSKLTDQERKVLVLIADCKTNRQIGNELHLAEKTVKNYVSNLLTKLGLERRTEAAIFAIRHLSVDARRQSKGGESVFDHDPRVHQVAANFADRAVSRSRVGTTLLEGVSPPKAFI